MKIYGNNLGWSDDKNFNNKQSRTARKDFRSQVVTTPEEAPTTKYNGMKSDGITGNFDAADFVDAIMPTNAIGNFVGMGVDALTGNDYTPTTYVSGFNPFGYAKDTSNGSVGKLALRGLDAYTTLGMPGASKAIDKLGTRFAPKLGTLGSKSKYISRKGTEKVVDESGKTVGRTLSKWNWNSLAPWKQSAGNGVETFGRRSIQRAANEGALDQFAINNGMNNVVKYATTAVKNPNTGTTFFFKNSAVHPYDATINRAMQVAPYWGYGSNQVIQQVTE